MEASLNIYDKKLHNKLDLVARLRICLQFFNVIRYVCDICDVNIDTTHEECQNDLTPSNLHEEYDTLS